MDDFVERVDGIIRREAPHLIVDGPVQADVALDPDFLKEHFPFSEIKERRFYDKPSVAKKKKQAKAAKRRRKRMKKFSSLKFRR